MDRAGGSPVFHNEGVVMKQLIQSLLAALVLAAVAATAAPVNINHADASTLARELSGVGMARAEAIVAYRESNGQIAFIDSLYGHLKVRSVRLGQQVTRGQVIGTMGRGPRNMYSAHLHFEIRKDLRVGMHRSLYPRDFQTYHSPRHFMDQRRQLRFEDRLVRVPVNTFQKTNPNRITAEQIEMPELTSVSETVRPAVPEEVEAVIEEETTAEAAAPEKSKGLFDSFLKRLAAPQ